MKKANLTCPYCNSTDVSKPKFSPRAFAISVLLVGFPILFTKKICFCFNCSKEFKVNSKKISNP